MKKVLQFISALNDGGAETLIKDYAININKSKFEMIIVTIYNYANTANYNILRHNNIKIIPIFDKWTFKYKIINRLFKNIYIKKKFIQIIKEEHPDIIHIHMNILKYVVLAKEELKNISLFYTCHSLPERYFGKGMEDEYDSAKLLIKNNNLRLIALHQDMANELNQMFDVQNTFVLYNCIDIDKFSSVFENKSYIRQKLSIPENIFVIGHVGRFAPQKNHMFIVELFKYICEKNNNVFLLLIGYGIKKN